ncbi:conserved hypothetical protein [Ricinus communis]|uniref:Uncharacterized protein n=1 Tax=Ricinus communis TaxID=3988 RepID=B9S3M7_RICCO|nr:conserved hypothetical protein [Ricinus communis]
MRWKDDVGGGIGGVNEVIVAVNQWHMVVEQWYMRFWQMRISLLKILLDPRGLSLI